MCSIHPVFRTSFEQFLRDALPTPTLQKLISSDDVGVDLHGDKEAAEVFEVALYVALYEVWSSLGVLPHHVTWDTHTGQVAAECVSGVVRAQDVREKLVLSSSSPTVGDAIANNTTLFRRNLRGGNS